MTKLVNVYTPAEVRVWLRVIEDGNLELEECNFAEEIGVRPDWLDDELNVTGWDDILDVTGGIGFNSHCLNWALYEGIAPYQPFLITLTRPCYRQDYYGEWDVDYYWNVIAIKPWTQSHVARAWARIIARITDAEIAVRKAHAELHQWRLEKLSRIRS